MGFNLILSMHAKQRAAKRSTHAIIIKALNTNYQMPCKYKMRKFAERTGNGQRYVLVQQYTSAAQHHHLFKLDGKKSLLSIYC